MKIYFTGAQRTGKTTLAKLLAANFDNFEYLDAKVSEFLKSRGTDAKTNLGNHELNAVDSAIETQEALSEYLYMTFRNNNNFVSDRSLVDVAGYTGYIAHRNQHVLDDIAEMDARRTEQQCITMQSMLATGHDTIIFVINPTDAFEFVEDEKSGSKESQKKCGELMLKHANSMKAYGIIEVIPDDCTAHADRLRFCLDAIERRKFR